MSKRCCQKCNNFTDFLDVPAKFCQFCGNPFSSTIAAQVSNSFEIEMEQEQIPPPRSKIRQQSQEYRPQASRLRKNNPEPEDEDFVDNLDIDSFEFSEPEIDINNLPRRNTVRAENIVFDKNVGQKENINRPKLKIDKKNIDKDFKESINRNGKSNSFEMGGQL